MNSKKEKKTIVGLIVSILVLLMFTVGMTFAYFTANSSATSSTMTFGTLEVGANSFNASSAECHAPMVPGCTIELEGTIELAERDNQGDVTESSNIDAFVRIALEISAPENAPELPATTNLMSAITGTFTENGWLAPNPADGYLYYTKKFVPVDTANQDVGNDETKGFDLSALSFTISQTLFGNEWQGKSFVLTITVEAIQAEHLGITLLTTGDNKDQTNVNAIAGVTNENALAAWAAVGGSSDPAPVAPSVAPSVISNLSITPFSESQGASENGVNEMSTLNNIVASNSALMSVTNTASVSKANSVTAGGDAFWKANNELVIPDYILKNGSTYYAYANYSNSAYFASQSNEVTILDVPYTVYKVTSIDDEAFSECGNLASITLPNTLLSIGDEAFYECGNLASITLPNTLLSIGEYAFCLTAITSFTLPSTLTTLGEGVLSGCYSFESFDFGNNNSITAISDYLFQDCTNLTSIEIPSTITSIGRNAFERSGLTSITIPNNVTSIGRDAFSDCSDLTSVTFESGLQLTSIGYSAFNSCNGLTTIAIPSSVTSIGQSAFYECSGLTSVTIDEGVTYIGEGAFGYCELLGSISIPNSIEYIGQGAFEATRFDSSLEYLNEDNGAYYLGNSTNPYVVLYSANSYTGINSNTRIIYHDVFSMKSAVTSVTIPSNVKFIGAHAFEECTNLTSVVFENGCQLKYIGYGAFCNCDGLTSFTIPASVISIERQAFVYCDSLGTVTFEEINNWYIYEGSSTNGTLVDVSNSTATVDWLIYDYPEYCFRRIVS